MNKGLPTSIGLHRRQAVIQVQNSRSSDQSLHTRQQAVKLTHEVSTTKVENNYAGQDRGNYRRHIWHWTGDG
jgi:hypothetical protein